MLKTVLRTMGSGMGAYGTLLMLTLAAASAQSAEIIRIVGQDPKVLETPDTQVDGKDGQLLKWRQILRSEDGSFEAGIGSMQKHSEAFESFHADQFLFALEGSVRLTSADGSVLNVAAGDALFIPKGWKGKWDTNGFKDVYVIYDPKNPAAPSKEHPSAQRSPKKISSTDNLALSTPDVQQHDVFKYRVLGKSVDGRFRTGLSSMKSTRNLESGSDVDEVLIMVEGSETFTSSDGTVIKSVPGDVVFMPKGWKGHYSTEGYQEIYVIYGPECMAQNNC